MKALTFLEFYTQFCEKYGEDALYDVRKLNALAKYNKFVSQPFSYEKIIDLFTDFQIMEVGYNRFISIPFQVLDKQGVFYLNIMKKFGRNGKIELVFEQNEVNDLNNIVCSMPKTINDFISICSICDIKLKFTPEIIKQFGLDKL